MKKTHSIKDKSQMNESVKSQRDKIEPVMSKIPFVPVSVDFDFGFSPCEHAQSKRIKTVGEETVMDKKEQRALEKEHCALDLYQERWGTFSTVMIYLIEYVQQVSTTTRKSVSTNLAESYRVLKNMIVAAQGKSRKNHKGEFTLHFSGNVDAETFSATFPIVDDDDIDIYNDYIRAAVAAPRILAETSVQQIVNAWEHFLGRLFGIKYSLDPQSIASNISVTMADILRAGDFKGVKELFENKAVKEFLRNSTEDQLNVLKNELGVNFVDMFSGNILKELKEIVLRRHIIVHCDSIAMDDYCKEIKKLGLPLPKRGEVLLTDISYAVRAWDILYAAGVIIAYMACIKHARDLKSKNLERFANGRLVTTSFEALKHGRLDAVCLILEYANKIKIQSEWSMLAIKINLAIAYKKQGRTREMDAVLNGYNWDFAPKEFIAASLALKGENRKALKALFEWCGADLERIRCAHEWIVFEDLREDPEFERRMARLRVKGGKELVKVAAPSVNAQGDKSTRVKRLTELFETAVKYAHKG